MSSTFRIEPAEPDDLDEITKFLVPAFASIPSEQSLGNIDTPTGHTAVARRHAAAWQLHARESQSQIPCAIKCIHEPTGAIAGFCEWFVYEHGRSQETYAKPHFLLSGDWLSPGSDAWQEAREQLQPTLDTRVKWMGQRPFALLINMAVHPAWRRKGVSTLCVGWGLDKCRQLGIPAYLEASKEGALVYQRLGFEQVEMLNGNPSMIKWPEGCKDEDKRPALPEWKAI